ncbi:hypothetical protein M2396_002835 [Pseudomonas sp. BIGb0278]|nr:hypothetical protein [Pseudomonas sp. BIGb0278]
MDILTQAYIDIGHQAFLQRGSSAHPFRNQQPQECPQQRAQGKPDTAKATKVEQSHSQSVHGITPYPSCTEVIMKIRELAQHWEQNAAGSLSPTSHILHLDLESEARLAALIDMFPKRTAEELLGELVASALEELEASFPYVQGRQVIATDEQGDPMYEDVGSTPRFLALSRQHLQTFTSTDQDPAK